MRKKIQRTTSGTVPMGEGRRLLSRAPTLHLEIRFADIQPSVVTPINVSALTPAYLFADPSSCNHLFVPGLLVFSASVPKRTG